MNTYTATLPDGQIVTRQTAKRTYSHVIAVAVTYAAMLHRVSDSVDYAERMLANAKAGTVGAGFDAEAHEPSYWEERLAERLADTKALIGHERTEVHHWTTDGWAGRPDLAEAHVRTLRNRKFTAEAIPAQLV